MESASGLQGVRRWELLSQGGENLIKQIAAGNQDTAGQGRTRLHSLIRTRVQSSSFSLPLVSTIGS